MQRVVEKTNKGRAAKRRRRESEVSFIDYHKQTKADFVIYAGFESLLRRIHGCDRLKKNV